MKKIKPVLMAFGAINTNDITLEEQAKRYTGVGTVKVIAVNPNKDELEKIYGRPIESAPEYVTKNDDGTTSARIDFIVQADKEDNNGVSFITRTTYFLRDNPIFTSDKARLKVIDNYGNTGWVTEKQLQEQEPPIGDNTLQTPFRPAMRGEEELIKFLKAWLYIPDLMRYDMQNKSWFENPKLEGHKERALVFIEKPNALFTGDFKELKAPLKEFGANRLKLLFGVRTTDDNKMYQDVFKEKPMKLSVRTFDFLEKALDSEKSGGRYPNTKFEIGPLKQFTLEKTEFAKDEQPIDDLPFGDTPTGGWFGTK
jgi:hypothetical protein